MFFYENKNIIIQVDNQETNKLQEVCLGLRSHVQYWMCVWMCVMWRGSPVLVYCKLQHVVVLGHTEEILETRWLEYGSWGRLPCFPLMPPKTHAWHSGGLLDGTVAHMANHSSRAEVFSKGPGSNLKRDCLHRGQRPSGQERPISCWPLRDRHINSWVVTPLYTTSPLPAHTTINPFHV